MIDAAAGVSTAARYSFGLLHFPGDVHGLLLDERKLIALGDDLAPFINFS